MPEHRKHQQPDAQHQVPAHGGLLHADAQQHHQAGGQQQPDAQPLSNVRLDSPEISKVCEEQ
jgi:hypothetical protein